MTRRLILAALALFAFLSLESCGVSRLAGPVAAEPSHTSRQSNGGRKFDGSREGDNGAPTSGGIGALPDMSDSLRVFRNPSPIGGGTGGDGGAGEPTGNEQPIQK